ELLLEVRQRTRVELELIQRLQRQPARQAARTIAGGAPARGGALGGDALTRGARFRIGTLGRQVRYPGGAGDWPFPWRPARRPPPCCPPCLRRDPRPAPPCRWSARRTQWACR